MLLMDIPLCRQLALLTDDDKNKVGEWMFSDKYDQDCVDKIWEEVKEPPYLKMFRGLSDNTLMMDSLFNQLDGLTFKIHYPEDGTFWIEILSECPIIGVKKSINELIKTLMGDELDIERVKDVLDWNLTKLGPRPEVLPVVRHKRWCMSPYCHKWWLNNMGDDIYELGSGSNNYLHRKEYFSKTAILSDYQEGSWMLYEEEGVPIEYFNNSGNQGEVFKVCMAKGQDPRRRYLREKYHLISENLDALIDITGLDSEKTKKWIEEWNVKQGYWTAHTTPLGNVKFNRNQSDIKYYKDYLKFQLGLVITPFRNYADRKSYKKDDGSLGFYNVSRMGFRYSRWKKYGIGEVDNYNCSLLNYIGREKIFQRDNNGLVVVRDGQYNWVYMK